ncbi:HD domain-containing protein [Chamaesiphon polymorphus]|uniref:Phosphohydrolase n=1 Tax=Chamaesiphon polymorphus CCALA 037 TaxID=2107692 RepID=A0A2T1F751_9CYAN|nr:HD domain-containing protein [Chamaesiphon polymorphus]PSB40811.1 phosphohydrolase [Chamaesiphon polymorphus CCALA 037]
MAQQFKTFQSVSDAYKLLVDLGAPDRLIQHVKLVGEAAEILILYFQQLDLKFNRDWIRLGVAFHDVGKILYPSELVDKGNRHEAAGELLLLSKNIDPKIARCCRSHAQWQQIECDLEELVVALADNLWKGKRNTKLEERVITKVAQILSRDYWDMFAGLDDKFEEIAATGDRRLARSM